MSLKEEETHTLTHIHTHTLTHTNGSRLKGEATLSSVKTGNLTDLQILFFSSGHEGENHAAYGQQFNTRKAA